MNALTIFTRRSLKGLLLAIMLWGATNLAAAEKGWTENYEEALEASKTSGKPMLLLFTGSDWCPPCKQLKRAVFTSEEFKEYAADNLVLMMADFPRGPQKEAIARQNQELSRQFPIRGYPTVLLIEPQKGEVVFAQSGYGGQSASAYVEALKAAQTKG